MTTKCIRKDCMRLRHHQLNHVDKHGLLSLYTKLEIKILKLETEIKYMPYEIKDKQRSITYWETQIRIANNHIKNRKLDIKNLKIKTRGLESQLKKELKKGERVA